MVSITLLTGDHTVRWSLPGYSDITATITVTGSGDILCKSVVGGSCDGKTPGVVVSGTAVTGYLAAVTVPEICKWIENKGGPGALKVQDIFELVDSYIGIRSIGFTPTEAHILGTIDYYGGYMQSGNSMTGCKYT